MYVDDDATGGRTDRFPDAARRSVVSTKSGPTLRTLGWRTPRAGPADSSRAVAYQVVAHFFARSALQCLKGHGRREQSISERHSSFKCVWDGRIGAANVVVATIKTLDNQIAETHLSSLCLSV